MYFDDFKLNDTIKIPPAVIDKEEMMDFARKYDNIPLHTDEEYARSTPFGQLIAPGVMSAMAVWAKYRRQIHKNRVVQACFCRRYPHGNAYHIKAYGEKCKKWHRRAYNQYRKSGWHTGFHKRHRSRGKTQRAILKF